MIQNDQHTTEEDDSLTDNTQPPSHKKDDAPTQKVIGGALNNALIRTLRSKIIKNPQKKNNNITVPTQQQNNTQVPIKHKEAIVHTLHDDVKRLIRTKKMSLVRIAALESKEKENVTNIRESHNTWRSITMIILLLLFITISGVVAWGVYYAYRFKTETHTAYTLDPSLFFAENRQRVDISNVNDFKILSYLNTLRTTAHPELGTITELYVTKTPTQDPLGDTTSPIHIRVKDLLQKFSIRLPDSFISTLGKNYMIGLYTTDNGNEPFLALTTSSYSYAFNGLLTWETTMTSALRPFFVSIDETFGNNKFVDKVYNNIDVRVLYDSFNKPILMYAFVNQTSFVIATSKRTLLEVISRMQVQ